MGRDRMSSRVVVVERKGADHCVAHEFSLSYSHRNLSWTLTTTRLSCDVDGLKLTADDDYESTESINHR
jgi:hypothetical protein